MFQKTINAVLVVLFLLRSLSAYAGKAEWLQLFYESRGVCVTTAKVVDISEDASSLLVNLEVDQLYIERLKRGGDKIVTDWLALHCPLPLAAYGKYIGDTDVVVKATEELVLSCKSFELSR